MQIPKRAAGAPLPGGGESGGESDFFFFLLAFAVTGVNVACNLKSEITLKAV